jgi:hypothetical protein
MKTNVQHFDSIAEMVKKCDESRQINDGDQNGVTRSRFIGREFKNWQQVVKWRDESRRADRMPPWHSVNVRDARIRL